MLGKENYILKIYGRFFVWARRVINGLWLLFDSFNDDQMYLEIDFKHVAHDFIESNIKDIEEFCASYTYAQHEKAKLLDNYTSKSKMYVELLSFFQQWEQQQKT